ncbi:MAG: hypothetical protein M1269_10560 [Chloroflexi bacterium]|nr:hypothetical protein [Chloroflexota bacterium]
MRKRFAVLFLTLVVFCAAGFSAAWPFQNEPDGFSDLEWGADISKYNDFELIIDSGDSKLYIRKDDLMKFGEADLQLLAYQFYKGKFAGILMQVGTEGNIEALKNAAFEIYGEGVRKDPAKDEWIWDGDTASITLKYDRGQEKGVLLILSKKFMNIEENAGPGAGSQ